MKDLPIAEISQVDATLAEAIRRMRAGEVLLQPGYDGEYGVVRLFQPGELAQRNQLSLF